MAPPVKYRVRDGVAIVTLAAPPANAVSAAVRASLYDIFGRIAEDDRPKAAILIAEGELFSGGADIRDMHANEASPTLSDVCRRIETLPIPVIAGLQGPTLGAGADLALACHKRVAAADATIGLPEVTLGHVPSGGATQRLPRLVSAKLAFDMLLTGGTMDAIVAQRAGLIDGIVEGHLHMGCWNYAQKLAEDGLEQPPKGKRHATVTDGKTLMAEAAQRREAAAKNRLFAPGLIIDCVEAALLLPIEAGLAMETDAADRCRRHPQSAALRHAFIVERRINPRILEQKDGQRVVAEPIGTTILGRMRHVMGAVAEHMRMNGTEPALIDKALIDFGFARTPYEGRVGGAGTSGDRIARRFVTALMVDGAQQVANGVVGRAGDIDALAIHGLGFPRFWGGPMKAAELMGLLSVKKDLERWQDESALWAPPPLLTEAIKTAAGFDGVRLAA